MATAQATAVKAITSSESLMATKNLLAALVSELCFSRNIFDSEGAPPRSFELLGLPAETSHGW